MRRTIHYKRQDNLEQRPLVVYEAARRFASRLDGHPHLTITTMKTRNLFTRILQAGVLIAGTLHSTVASVVEPPAINCSPARTVQCGESWSFDEPAATVSCGVATVAVVSTMTNAACGNTFTATRTWQVTDECERTNTCSQVITVQDTNNPAITCPADVTVECFADLPPVDLGALTASDCSDVITSHVGDEAVTNGFVITMTRTYKATDLCGNSAACVQIITVQDTTAPNIFCPPDLTIECAGPGGIAGSTAVFYGVELSENCDFNNLTMVCDPPTGSLFPLGTTTVNCTAADASGNTNTCGFTVTVADTTRPDITCPADLTLECAGPDGTTANWIISATDACDANPTVVCNPAPGSTFALGTSTVTCVASDTSGNATNCSFTITVADETMPGIACPPNLTVECAGTAGTVATWNVTASDACDATSPAVVCDPATGSAFALGTTTVTCSATDTSGNRAECSFTVTVADTTAPNIFCPTSATIECLAPEGIAGATVVLYPLPETSDQCDLAVAVVCEPPAGNLFPLGTTTVNCTATDTSGNTNACDFSITVVDTLPPELRCPTNGVFDCAIGAEFIFEAVATDFCDTNVTVSCEPPSGSRFALGTTTVNCTATDASGNTTSCSFTITRVDETAPTITCPSDLTVTIEPISEGVVVPFSVSAMDNCGDVVPVCAPPSDSFFTPGATTVVCSVSDAAGNTNECRFVVTVIVVSGDTEAPTIVCPGSLTLDCAGPEGTPATFTASATDNVDTSVIVICVPPSGTAFPPGETTVVCTAADVSGNATNCSFTVTISDTTPPLACLEAKRLVTSGVDDHFDDLSNVEPAAPSDGLKAQLGDAPLRSFDDCVLSRTFAHTFDNLPAGEILGARLRFRLAACEDTSVDDVIKLQFANPDGSLLPARWERSIGELAGGLWLFGFDLEFPALDLSSLTNADGSIADLLPTLRANRFLDIIVAEDTMVDFIELELTICACHEDLVADNDPGECGATVSFAPPAFTDLCDANLSIVCTPPSGTFLPLGLHTVTCVATDASGNASRCEFSVVVRDTEAPVVVCPEPQIVECEGLDGTAVNFAASATDNCDGIVPVDCAPASGTVFAPGATIVTCSTTDSSDNSGACEFVVVVQDATAPAITCPSSQTVECAGPDGTVAVFEAAASDLCDTNVVVSCEPPSGGLFPAGITTVTCTAADSSGNKAECSFTVTVADGAAPSLTCPDSQTLACTGPDGAVATFTASAVDACDTNATVECVPASASAFAPGTTTVTCTATDAAGNRSECSFTVTVTDVEPPVVVCPGDITMASDNDLCGAVVRFDASASDTCGSATVVCQPASDSIFPVGTTSVACTATDAAGNTNACAFAVTVLDQQAPVIICSSNLTATALPDQTTALVGFTVAATDNCGSPTVVCAPPSGSAFPVGATTVECSASDVAGNTNTCSFTVTVEAGCALHTASALTSLVKTVGESVVFTTEVAGVGPFTFVWRHDGAVVPDVTGNSLAIGSVKSADAGAYCVEVTGPCGSVTNCTTLAVIDPFDACLISHWKFDEGASVAALDAANGNRGTLVNGPVRTPGRFGDALRFDGVNDHVNVPDSHSLDVSNKFSISLWFKPSELLNARSGRKDIFAKYAAYWLIMNFPTNDGRLAFALNTGGEIVKSRTDSWQADRWYHAAATYDGAMMKLYVDGVLEGAGATTALPANTIYPLQIGGDTFLSRYFPGCIDDARLYGCALTAAEVLNLFGGSLPANHPPAISAIADQTTHKNETITGIPFTIADAETLPSFLTVSASSDNPVLVPTANLVPGGSGFNRNLTITPASGQSGTAKITVTVSDGEASASTLFTVTVLSTPAPAAALISRWRFDEPDGLTALDSANGNPGALLNGPVRAPGKLGGALRFDGVNDVVSIPDNNSLDVSNKFSIALWFKPSQLLDASCGRKDLFRKYASYWLIMNFPSRDGKLAFVLNTGTPIVKSTTTSWNADQWYHAAAVYDGMNMNLYVNGVLEGSVPAVAVPKNTIYPVQIGGSTELNFYFPGCIDDARLYGSCLSAADVQGVIDEATPPPPAPAPLLRELARESGLAVRMTMDDGLAKLVWKAVPGKTYRVQYKNHLGDPTWHDLPGEVLARDEMTATTDFVGDLPQRFYRVVALP